MGVSGYRIIIRSYFSSKPRPRTRSGPRITYFVWLPLAESSPLLFLKTTVVYASVFPTIGVYRD